MVRPKCGRTRLARVAALTVALSALALGGCVGGFGDGHAARRGAPARADLSPPAGVPLGNAPAPSAGARLTPAAAGATASVPAP
ncbi:hypothetical protein MBRA_03556 [Methylobacterium brachiatum]|nr:hypothetical protein MBRA_03556 [Methylobacterium brachiatum]